MLFELVRHTDVSGVSGTGVIVEGVQLSSGTCMVEWVCGKWLTQGVYPDIQAVIDVHGHGGETEVRYVRAFTGRPQASERGARRDAVATDASQSDGRDGANVARSLRSVPRR